MSTAVATLVAEASADVTRSDHAEECLAAHAGEACPGYPHEEKDQT